MSFLFGPTTLTSTNQSQQQQSGSTSGSSSSTPTLSPQLQQIFNSLQNYSQQSLTDPTAALAPIRNAGLQQINQQYAGVPQQVTNQLAARGYGSSGAMGDALYQTNLARAGAASSLEGQLATQGIQQQQFGASLGDQLLNSLKGTDNTSSGTTSTSGTSSGTNTQPGPSIFSSLAGLFGTLTGLGAFSGSGSGASSTPPGWSSMPGSGVNGWTGITGTWDGLSGGG